MFDNFINFYDGWLRVSTVSFPIFHLVVLIDFQIIYSPVEMVIY